MDYVLRTFELTKRYKNHWALNKVTMNIQRGDIYGFVGENGSGKTTVIRLITGLISQNSGSYELFGVSSSSPDIINVRKRIGAIVETPSIYLNMSAHDNLKMQSAILGINDEEKIKEVLFEVGLFGLYDDSKKAGNFSLGMRQRLGIAMALLGNPEFIILDEPMNGLDPAGIVEIRELIIRLNREKNITFLISSHILTELSLVATKYGIISKGKIIKEISAEDLKKECRPAILIEADNQTALLELLSKHIKEDDLAPTAKGVRIYGNISLNWLFEKIINAGIDILNVVCSESNIENYYLSIMPNVIGGNYNA